VVSPLLRDFSSASLSLWTWRASDLALLDKNMAHFEEIVGRIEGMIFLASCICDLPLDAVEWSRRWIAKVGDEPL